MPREAGLKGSLPVPAGVQSRCCCPCCGSRHPMAAASRYRARDRARGRGSSRSRRGCQVRPDFAADDEHSEQHQRACDQAQARSHGAIPGARAICLCSASAWQAGRTLHRGQRETAASPSPASSLRLHGRGARFPLAAPAGTLGRRCRRRPGWAAQLFDQPDYFGGVVPDRGADVAHQERGRRGQGAEQGEQHEQRFQCR